VLVEVQVTRPGPARTALLDVLDGLDQYDDLVETLTAHVQEGGRRTDTAKRLHVHPNTLDYRLRRIREITGVDPGDRDGAQLLRSALIVRAYLTASRRAL
jgi:DNA-binding PucR family transcriptional regulator